jgi:hypothetical protein
MRCIKSNRICHGYKLSVSAAFRNYEAQGAQLALSQISIARKCTLPIRVPIPGTDVFPDDVRLPEVTESAFNVYSLRAFIYDFCVVSPNQNLSRGFLSGVEAMVQRRGLVSNLAKACYAVCTASHGKPLQRPNLTYMSKAMYQDLLGCLAKAIDNPDSASAAESKVVAMLLGTYQVPIDSTIYKSS